MSHLQARIQKGVYFTTEFQVRELKPSQAKMYIQWKIYRIPEMYN